MLRFASPLRVRPANVVEPRCTSFVTPQRLPPPQPAPVSMKTTTVAASSQPAQTIAAPIQPAQTQTSTSNASSSVNSVTVWNNGMPFQHLPKWQPPEFDSSFLPVPDSPDPTPLQDPHKHFNWPSEHPDSEPKRGRQRCVSRPERFESDLGAPVSFASGQSISGIPQVRAVNKMNPQDEAKSPRFAQVRVLPSIAQEDQRPLSGMTSTVQSQSSVQMSIEEVAPLTRQSTPVQRPATPPLQRSSTPTPADTECSPRGSPRGPVIEVPQCQSLVSSGRSSNATIAPPLTVLPISQSAPRPLINTGLSWVAPSAETPRSARPHEETEATSSVWTGAPQMEWQCNPTPWQQAVPRACAESSGPCGPVLQAEDVTASYWATNSAVPVVEAMPATIASEEISYCEAYAEAAQDDAMEEELAALMAEVGDLRQQFAALLSERENLKKELCRTTEESDKYHRGLCTAREELSDLLDTSRNEMDKELDNEL